MFEKSSFTSGKLSLVLTTVIFVLCVGALVRVELILREQRELINMMQEKTDCMASCRLKTSETKEVLKDSSTSKHRFRRYNNHSTTNDTVTSQDLHSLILLDIPGPPGRTGPIGPQGPMGPPGLHCKSATTNYPPKVSLPVGPIYVKEGNNLTLSCHVTGYPKPKVTWSKVMDFLPSKRSLINENRLKVLSVQNQDSGLYVCAGSNTLGSAVETIKIIVVSLPKFISAPPQHIIKNTCDKLTLGCQAAGDPPAVITWNKENGLLPADRTHTVNGRLTITGLKTSDAGTYVCTAVSAGVATSKLVTPVTVLKGGKGKFKFTRDSVTDYIVVKRKLPAMARFTVCLWMMTPKSDSTMISYAVPGNSNEIILLNHPKTIYVFVGGAAWDSGVRVIDGQWHHICATWENSAGQAVLYKDGIRRAQGSLKKGHVTKSGGSLIIGQEQDSFGGGFSRSQSFVGELTGINIWNRVLGQNEISAMSKNVGIPAYGNVLTWNDVISGTKYGQAQIIDSCKP